MSTVNSTGPLLLTLCLLGLGACATKVPDRIADAKTPTEHFVARVTTRDQEIRLAVHSQGLSATQVQALGEYAEDWRSSEGGVITVAAPTGGKDSAAVFRAMDGARTVLLAQGVPADRVQVSGYSAEAPEGAPLRISYVREQAVIPSCGLAWTNLAKSAKNEVQPNFGCAVTANMAAQIANPGDLLRPRGVTSPDAQRRAVVLDKYRKGQVTSSDKDEQAKGAVSNAVR